MTPSPETQITASFPPDLYEEIKRISAIKHWPESQAVVLLARLGAKYQKQMEQQWHSTYQAFIGESDPAKQDKLGDEMICAIFGPQAIG